jgi:hypothetical protein
VVVSGSGRGGCGAGHHRHVVRVHGAALLDADAIKPWRHRSWIFPRDPDFAAKAERVLNLYERVWNGRRLRPDEYVISADELGRDEAR